MLGLASSLVKGGASLLTFVKDNLKLYLDFKSSRSDTLAFPSEGSTLFDGVNDRIDVSATLLSGTYTVMGWVYKTLQDGSYFVDFRKDSGTGYFAFGNNSNNAIYSQSGTLYVNGVAGTTVPLNTWTHICVNGMTIESSTTKIGCQNNDTNFFKGSMTNVALWNRELSIEEINSVMNKSYSQLGSVEKTSLVMWQTLDSVDATGYMDTPGTNPSITTIFPTNIYLNSHGTTEYTEVMANNGNLTTQGAWNFQSGGTDSAFADTGVYSEGALKIKNIVIARVAINAVNASVLEALIVGQLYKLEITYTRVDGQHAQAVALGLGSGYGFSNTDVKWKESYWSGSDGSASEKTITGYFFHESSKNELWIRSASPSIELHFKTISIKKVSNNAGGGGISIANENNHYEATLTQGATTTTSVYGGNAPILPRAIDIAESFADAIGNGSAYFGGHPTDDHIVTSKMSINFNSFSISLWAKPINFTSDDAFLCIADADSNDEELLLYNQSSSNNKFSAYLPDPNTEYNSTYEIPEGEWSHLVFTKSGDSLKLYANGIEVKSGSCVNNNTYSRNLFIGARKQSSIALDINSYIAGVGVWQGALSQAQIQSVMESTSYAKIPADVKSTLGSDELPSPDLTSGTGLTITQGSTGALTHDTSAGTITATNDVQDGYLRWNSASLVENKLYKLEIVVDSYTGGRFRTTLGWNGTSFYPSVGTNIQYFVGNATASFGIRIDDGNPAEFVISKISVKEVTNDLVAYYPLDADSSANGVTNDATTGETLGSNTFVSLDNFASNNGGQVAVANNEITLTIPSGDNVGMQIGNLAGFGISSSLGYAINDLAKISFEAKVVTNASGFGNTLKFVDNQGNVITNTDITLTTEYQTFTNYYVLTTVSGYRIPMWYRNGNRSGEDVQKFRNFSIQKVTSNTGVLK